MSRHNRGLRFDFADGDSALPNQREVFTHHRPLTCAMAGERIAELEALQLAELQDHTLSRRLSAALLAVALLVGLLAGIGISFVLT